MDKLHLLAGSRLECLFKTTIGRRSGRLQMGKYKVSTFFLGKHRQSKHTTYIPFPTITESSPSGSLQAYQRGGGGRSTHSLTHSLTPSTLLPAARIGSSSTSACALRCSALSVMTRRCDQCRRSTAKWPRDHVHRYLLPPSESNVLSSRGRRRSPSILPPHPLLNLLSILSDHLNSAALYRIIARHVFCFDTRH